MMKTLKFVLNICIYIFYLSMLNKLQIIDRIFIKIHNELQQQQFFVLRFDLRDDNKF